jgi:hypothetical protein
VPRADPSTVTVILRGMASDTWNSVAVPLLEHFAEREAKYAQSTRATDTLDIAQATGLELAAVELELKRLFDGGYLAGQFEGGSGADSGFVLVPTLTERGARAAGKWPSEDPAEALIAIVDRRLREAQSPEERTAWQKIKDGFTAVPGNVLGSLAVELGKAAAGFAS